MGDLSLVPLLRIGALVLLACAWLKKRFGVGRLRWPVLVASGDHKDDRGEPRRVDTGMGRVRIEGDGGGMN